MKNAVSTSLRCLFFRDVASGRCRSVFGLDRLTAGWLLLVFVVFSSGCGGSATDSTQKEPRKIMGELADDAKTLKQPITATLRDEEFHLDPLETETFRIVQQGPVEFLRPKENTTQWIYTEGKQSCRITGSDGTILTKIVRTNGKLIAHNTAGDPLFQFHPKAAKVILTDASGEKARFTFRTLALKIKIYSEGEQGSTLIGQIQKIKDGWQLADGLGKTKCRTERRDGQTILSDANGKTMVIAKSLPDDLGLVFLGIPQLDALEQLACCIHFCED